MDEGRCPQCRRDGPAGEPCSSPGCRLRRHHYIPASYVADADLDDPMLGRVVADFLVVGILGSGGFGNVHHVLQLPLRSRPVQGALKRLRPAGPQGNDAREQATLLQRFESEADALASLSHPNIVRLLKAGLDGDTPYLVLELVADAETLERELEDHARHGVTLGDTEIIAITEQILNALEAAHAQGIVHRDIKPGNVMLQRVAGYDVFVRVLDFGLAKFIAESSETQRVMGTLDYMAPEQLRGRDIGAWTDLYALGLLVLTMVSGRVAFSADRAVLVNEKLDPTYDPVRFALRDRDIDAERSAFLRRATAHDRHERYATVPAFRRAFHAAFFEVAPRDRQRKQVRTRDLSQTGPGEVSLPALLGRGADLIRLPTNPIAEAAPRERGSDLRVARSLVEPPPAAAPAPPPPAAAPPPSSLWPARTDPSPLPVAPLRSTTPPPASSQPPGGAGAPGGARWPLLEAVDRSRGKRKPFELPPGFERSRPASEPEPRAPANITQRHGDKPIANPKGFFDTVDASDEKKEP